MKTVNKKDIVSMITHWSKTFGLPIKEEKEFPNEERTLLTLALIKEEVEELEDAIKQKDLIEVQDALGDILWLAIRGMQEHGINPLETIEKIYNSNMSKADYTLDDVEVTRNKYLRQGIETYVEEVDGIYITHRKSDGKVVKSHSFIEPKFD